jgi:hypothetical protein
MKCIAENYQFWRKSREMIENVCLGDGTLAQNLGGFSGDIHHCGGDPAGRLATVNEQIKKSV